MRDGRAEASVEVTAQATLYATYAEASPRGAEALRYATAGLSILAACGALALVLSQTPADTTTSDIDNAVLVDLAPPTEASAQPASAVQEGPEQQATQAMPPQPTPPEVNPAPEPTPTPPDEPKTPPSPDPSETPPLPLAPHPAAALENMQAQALPPQPMVTLPVPPQDERAPAGSEIPMPVKPEDDSDDGAPHASAHAITVWQRALMRRLEGAKRMLSHERHAIGTVRVEFAVNATGALAFARVVSSSGSSALDQAAIGLVKEATPFPAPPAGSGSKATSFVVPIRFR